MSAPARGSRFPRVALALGAVLLLVVLLPVSLSAQASGATPSLRPYWHVFIAYAIAWVLVLGWIVAVARRLARVEARLAREEDRGRS